MCFPFYRKHVRFLVVFACGATVFGRVSLCFTCFADEQVARVVVACSWVAVGAGQGVFAGHVSTSTGTGPDAIHQCAGIAPGASSR